MTTLQVKETKQAKLIIGILSVAIPLVVALLLFVPTKIQLGTWVYNLPHVIGLLNTITSIVLLLALVTIKQKKVTLHQNLMYIAFTLGALFLVSYVLYHATVPSTVFGDVNGDGILDATEKDAVGSMRGIYLFTLLSHILLSISVLPFVLLAFYFALSGNIISHKKIVKFTFPIWLYVSITGVLIYLMIRPFYNF